MPNISYALKDTQNTDYSHEDAERAKRAFRRNVAKNRYSPDYGEVTITFHDVNNTYWAEFTNPVGQEICEPFTLA